MGGRNHAIKLKCTPLQFEKKFIDQEQMSHILQLFACVCLARQIVLASVNFYHVMHKTHVIGHVLLGHHRLKFAKMLINVHKDVRNILYIEEEFVDAI